MAKMYGLARLGRNAELRTTGSGEVVVSLSLAFSYGKKGDDGKRQTQWVDGALWGARATALAPYLLKGGLIVATLDDVHIETFRKSDGTEGVKLAGRVSDLEFAGGSDRDAAPAQRAPAAQRPASAPVSRQTVPASTDSSFDDFSDSIPF